MPPETAETLAARLEALRAKRGYLLPHHGLMALTAPALLEGYDAAYTAMALDDRVLSHHDREFVWLAVLIATGEGIATHHITKFYDAGGTDDEVAAIMALTAACRGFEAYDFVEAQWHAHMPGIVPETLWSEALARATPGAASRLVQLAALAVHAAHGEWRGLRWQLRAAYAARVPELEMAEALSLMMFPGSIPRFVSAARLWREMILDGTLAASEGFRAWAALAGQEGHQAQR
jgi:alkylhydroperoxidase/carboxymuconolactone decarboxylase family protein YurZ